MMAAEERFSRESGKMGRIYCGSDKTVVIGIFPSESAPVVGLVIIALIVAGIFGYCFARRR